MRRQSDSSPGRAESVAARRRARGPWRRRWYALIAVSLPFAALLVLEAVLRLAGVASPEPLFVAAPEQGWLQPNERVIRRFFADPAEAPAVSIDSAYFRAEKADGAFRAFVLGGSSAAGFPYGKWASLAGILEQRWRMEHPFREIEVVPVAMSAINSWALADFIGEVLAHEPDAVLVYAGHNEYLGVLGVGSAFGGGHPGLTRLSLALQRIRVVRLVNRLVAATGGKGDDASGTLMARIAAERSIPYDSDLFHAGVEQFRSNLDRLLGACRRAGVPAYVGTLASNEGDQPPFLTVPPAGTALEEWRGRVEAARELLDANRTAEAQAAIETLIAAAPLAPDGYWLRGRVRLADAASAHEARTDFHAAKDRDPLRFRAPEAFNAVVRELAAGRDATVVDVQAALAGASPDRIIGSALMLEHLHPNHEGYALLAGAYHDALAAAGLPWPGGQELDAPGRRLALPLTEVERLAGEYRVLRLKSDWPFHPERQPLVLPEPRSEPERIAREWFEGRLDWTRAMNRALDWYQQSGRSDEAARIAVNLAAAFPFRSETRFIAGSLLMRDGQPARAVPYLHAAANAAPRDTRRLMALAQAYFLAGESENSARVLERVIALQPDHPTAPAYLEKVRNSPDPG